ncbi:MAG: hypothetical protein ACR2M1_10515 [Gemmatimonadaceae bacterium]
MDRMLPTMQRVMRRVFLTDSVTIAHELTPDAWLTGMAVPASVQHLREQPAAADPATAQITAARALVVYVADAVPVSVGDRVPWNGATWEVTSVTPERGAGLYTRFVMEQAQIGTPLLSVSFRRRVSAAWTEVGTFPVRKTQDQRVPNPLSRVSGSDAATALSADVTGFLAGDANLAVVRIGDWFALGGLPGRVLSVDTVNPDQTILAYRLEQRATR